MPSIGQIDDDFEASISRHTSTIKGKTYPDQRSNTQLYWTDNLRRMPSIDAFDIAAYLTEFLWVVLYGWKDENLIMHTLQVALFWHNHGVVTAPLGE